MAKDFIADDSVVDELTTDELTTDKLITDDIILNKDMADLIKVLPSVKVKEKRRVLEIIDDLNLIYLHSLEADDKK